MARRHRRMAGGLVAAAAVLALCASAAPARAGDDPLDRSLVSVRVLGGLTPYRAVTYAVLWRGKTAVASHTRTLVKYEEVLQRMSLVDRPEYEGLLARAEALGAFELPDAPAPRAVPGALRWEIEVVRGDRTHTVTVGDPAAQPDGRYRALIRLVKRFVVAQAGDLAFHNVFFEPGTFGFLNLTTVPLARVSIDGRDIGQETPLYGLELAVGDHELVVTDPKSGAERRHTARIEAGMTTILHVDLR